MHVSVRTKRMRFSHRPWGCCGRPQFEPDGEGRLLCATQARTADRHSGSTAANGVNPLFVDDVLLAPAGVRNTTAFILMDS